MGSYMNMCLSDLSTRALLLLELFRDDVLNPEIVKFEALKDLGYSEEETLEFLNTKVDITQRILRVI